jgi:glycogen debranching enzyme
LIAVHGSRAFVSGYATEGLDVWAYPFQVVSNYRIAFRVADSTTVINGANILGRITYEPDSVTRIYFGDGFIVRERILVPVDQPGAIFTYSIQGPRKVEIQVHAAASLNLMWPAALGGQSVEWDRTNPAFVLSEPAHAYSAVLGSPQVTAHDELENRAEQGAAEAELGLTLQPDAAGVAKVFCVLNSANAPDKSALLREMVDNGEALQSKARLHYADVIENMLRVKTPDERVNKAIPWSEIALDQAWMCNPDLGCGYVAGYGPSRSERRPQYAWYFAGDGLVAAEGAISAGDFIHARDELKFILRYQNTKTGMIWHELSQSAGYLDWAGKYPYMFVHVDITYQFLGVVAQYVATSGDIAFAREEWARIEAAYRYCNSMLDHATALPHIPADKEGSDEQSKMADDLGLSTSWVTASAAFAKLANLTDHIALADEATHASEKARASIAVRYWNDKNSFWVSGHTSDGHPLALLRSGPSEALQLHLFSARQNGMLLDRLASSQFQTDWGTRGMGEGSVGYDADSYASGSVWPVATARLAEAFWTEHRPDTALALWRALILITSLDSPGHIHEVLNGTHYLPQVESVPEQTWSSAEFLHATVHGLLGLEVDAVNRRVTFAPHIPAEWDDLAVENIKLGNKTFSVTLHRDSTAIALDVDNAGDAFQLEFSPQLPLGAKLLRAELNGRKVMGTVESDQRQTTGKVVVAVSHGKSKLCLDTRGGIALMLYVNEPRPGEASEGVRIVGVQLERNRLTIAADVPVDRASSVRIKTVSAIAKVDGATARTIRGGVSELTFAAANEAQASYRRAYAVVDICP